MSISRKVVVIVLLLALVALNSIAFAQSAPPDVPVKVAVMGPFTGPAASIGTEQLNWARLAVSDFNEATGWNVELVEADTQLDPAIAVTAAESLIADADIYGVVGPAGSQEFSAVGQQFADASLVQAANSATNPGLSQQGWATFFRVIPTDADQGPTVGNYLYNVLGATSLYVLDDQTSYAVGLADEAIAAFEAAGGTIAGRESVTQDDSDFSSLITVISGTGADAVFFPGQIASQGGLFAQQMVEQGADFILFGADGFQSVDDFILGAAGASEGAYVSAFAPDIHDLESSADVVTRYGEEYGEFGTFGPPTYAGMSAILEAIQRAYEAGDLSREAVTAEMMNTNVELSVLGTPLSFDEYGDVVGAQFYIFQVQGDNFVYLPTEGAEAEATEEASS